MIGNFNRLLSSGDRWFSRLLLYNWWFNEFSISGPCRVMTSTMAYLAKLFIRAIWLKIGYCKGPPGFCAPSWIKIQNMSCRRKMMLHKSCWGQQREWKSSRLQNSAWLFWHVACGICRIGKELNGHEWSFGGSGVEQCSPRCGPDFPLGVFGSIQVGEVAEEQLQTRIDVYENLRYRFLYTGIVTCPTWASTFCCLLGARRLCSGHRNFCDCRFGRTFVNWRLFCWAVVPFL